MIGFPRAAIVGVAESDEIGIVPHKSALQHHAEAAHNALADAGLSARDVDGLFTAGFSTLATGEYMGIRPRYTDSTSVGGASFVIHVAHAVAAINAGYCEVALITHGQTGRSARVRSNEIAGLGSVPSPMMEFEVPYGVIGPPVAYGMACSRYMHEFGEERTRQALAEIAVSTRKWPYVEMRQVQYVPPDFATKPGGAIHAMCAERSLGLLGANGRLSMILPLALTSTQRMTELQTLIEKGRGSWFANFSWRPGKLFDTVNRALTIFVVSPIGARTFSTRYQKWNSETRGFLLESITYTQVIRKRPSFWVPKLGDALEPALLSRLLAATCAVGQLVTARGHAVYYRTTGGLYWKVFTDFPPSFSVDGLPGHSSRQTYFTVSSRDQAKLLVAVLSSSAFWWWYTITSNLRDLNPSDIHRFPVPCSALSDTRLVELGAEYIEDITRNSTMLVREQHQTGRTETQSFKIVKSKWIVDQIDTVLAEHYGLTDAELDFILNYDIKYRAGLAEEDDE